MNNYRDETRGTVQVNEYMRQIVLFDGMKYKGRNSYNDVTPTDIDGFIQLDEGNIFVFFELKYDGDLPTGQRIAYERLIDFIISGGGKAILFVASHHTKRDTINAKTAIVTKAYDGEWHLMKGNYTLGSLITWFIERNK